MTDGWWEEKEYTWMNDFPFADDPDVYARINSLLPDDHVLVPLYTNEPRVMYLTWESDDQ